MQDKTPVEIPFSQLEYTVTFQAPMLELMGRLHDVVVPLAGALSPWGFVFEESEIELSSPKPRDHVVIFQRPSTAPPPQMRVAVRWSTVTVSIDQPDWGDAESILKLCDTAVNTVRTAAHARVQTQRVSLNMHVQSRTTPRSDLTGVLLTSKARELMDGEILGQGLILHRNSAMILIDNSAAFANGLFIRLQRTFDDAVGVAEMADILLADERKLWEVLGLEGEL